MKKLTNSYKWENLTTVVVLFVLMALTPLAVNAQRRRDLYVAPGKVVAEGTNTVPTGELKVKSYRLEEVKLPKPPEPVKAIEPEAVESKRGSRDLNLSGEQALRQRPVKVLRLTITGAELFNGDFIIWVDDDPLTNVSSGPELTALIKDPAILQDGATLAVSLYSRPKERTVLPELLRVPVEYQVMRASQATNTVTLRRVASSPQLWGEPGIEIEIDGVDPYAGNNALILQIGDEVSGLSRHPSGRRAIIFTLTLEQFARLETGDRMILKLGGGLASGAGFGKLDKSLLKNSDAKGDPEKR